MFEHINSKRPIDVNTNARQKEPEKCPIFVELRRTFQQRSCFEIYRQGEFIEVTIGFEYKDFF